jgi:hypothetical protein
VFRGENEYEFGTNITLITGTAQSVCRKIPLTYYYYYYLLPPLRTVFKITYLKKPCLSRVHNVAATLVHVILFHMKKFCMFTLVLSEVLRIIIIITYYYYYYYYYPMQLSFQNPKFTACVCSETVTSEYPSRTVMQKDGSMEGVICGSRSYRSGSSNFSIKFSVPFL